MSVDPRLPAFPSTPNRDGFRTIRIHFEGSDYGEKFHLRLEGGDILRGDGWFIDTVCARECALEDWTLSYERILT